MERAERSDAHQEWRLGIEPDQAYRAELTIPRPPLDASRERLERPLHVVTVENLAWLLIAAWALITRFAAVGARPMTADEARNSLFAYDLANRTNEAAAAGLQPAGSGWIHLAEAGIFALFGASDVTARVLFVLSGLLLVVMAFAVRQYAGRAGAIAIGAMLTISPTVAWFSRAGTSVICTASLALVTVVLFIALQAAPSGRRASALGLSAGLLISADPTGLVTSVIFVATLAIIGLFELLTTDNAYLRARVWLERYGGLVGTVVLTAAAVCVASQLVAGLGGGAIAEAIRYLISPRWGNLRAGFRAVILPLGFYEFLIVIAGAAGMVVVGAARVRTRFAFFCLLWTLLSFAFYLLAPPRAPDHIVMMLVPAALLGGFAVDYLHHSGAWNNVRYALAALALLTLYAQALTNFADYAPDPSEAPWARRANLYWRDGASTLQVVARCTTAVRGISRPDATVFHEGDWPAAVRWYLRGLRPVTGSNAAAIVVDTRGRGAGNDAPRANSVDIEESWTADPSGLTLNRALLYFFKQRAWGEVVTRSAIIEVGPQAGNPAPTLILPLGGP